MNNRRILGATIIVSLLLMTACSSGKVVPPTLTLDQAGCSYSGPKKLPAKFSLHWVIVDDQVHDYVYILLTLEKGKTQADLESWLSVTFDHPGWANIIAFDFSSEGGQTIVKDYDLTSNASYKGEPLYIVCTVGDQYFITGPVKVDMN